MKKKVLIISVSVICLIAILFSILWFVPELRGNVLGIPIKTVEFVPFPNVIMCRYAEREFVFSVEQSETIHQAFLELVPTLLKSEGTLQNARAINDTPWSPCMFLEFSYDLLYRYVGN